MSCDLCSNPACTREINAETARDVSKRFCERPECHEHLDMADMIQLGGDAWYSPTCALVVLAEQAVPVLQSGDADDAEWLAEELRRVLDLAPLPPAA